MMDDGRQTVVTAHIIERELMPVGLDHCVETLYHPAGRTDCEQAPSRLLLLHPCRWRHTMPALSSPRGERTHKTRVRCEASKVKNEGGEIMVGGTGSKQIGRKRLTYVHLLPCTYLLPRFAGPDRWARWTLACLGRGEGPSGCATPGPRKLTAGGLVGAAVPMQGPDWEAPGAKTGEACSTACATRAWGLVSRATALENVRWPFQAHCRILVRDLHQPRR